MKLLTITTLILFSLSGFSQISGTLITPPPMCQGDIGMIDFIGSNGTAPYTFTYTIDFGSNQVITTDTGSNSISIPCDSWNPGFHTYTLVSVQDATMTTQAIDMNYAVGINPTPLVSAGNNIVNCAGESVVLNASGAATYSWTNGVVNGVPFTPNIGFQTYYVTGVSANGCTATDAVIITTNTLPVAPTGVTIDSAHCSDGAITIAPTGSYTYEWNNGNTSPNLTNVTAGTYQVDVTDNLSGCVSTFSYDVPASSIASICSEITGFVYVDADGDCTVSSGDTPVVNRMVVANPGNYLTMSDANGFYSFNLPIGTYTISEIFNTASAGNFCNASYDVTLVNNLDSIGGNIFLDSIGLDVDYQAGIYSTTIAPGFTFSINPMLHSLGAANTLSDSTAWITFPAGVYPLSWGGNPYTVSNDTIYFQFNSVQSYYGSLQFIAGGVFLGQALTFCMGVPIQNGETVIANNTSCYTTIVIGSFDPNDKRTFINGVQNDSLLLLTEETLDYVVRFQNTGTAPAQDIYVLDTISANLDLNTFEFITSSHNCTVNILEGNVLRFNFPQIFLADSNANEPESHGFFHYRIKQNPDNILGDVIKNTAYIYFDFNEAVITNTTFDSIVELNTESIFENQLANFSLFPNPTEGETTISVNNNGAKYLLQVIDITGKVIYSEITSKEKVKINLADKNPGVYFVKIKTDDGDSSAKLIVK